jgi:hypothetical protein
VRHALLRRHPHVTLLILDGAAYPDGYGEGGQVLLCRPKSA